MKSNNYAKGKLGEDIAVNYLKNCGFEILDRNFAIKAAEIDIIAYKNNIVNFIEVKSSVERQIIALTNCITRSKYSYKIKIT